MDAFRLAPRAEESRSRATPPLGCLLVGGTIQTELSIGLRSRRTKKRPRKLVKRVLRVVPFVRQEPPVHKSLVDRIPQLAGLMLVKSAYDPALKPVRSFVRWPEARTLSDTRDQP